MKPDWTAPATRLADAEWVRARIGGAAKLYGCARPEVLGTIWWYSLSSVLVAPAVESLVAATAGGPAAARHAAEPPLADHAMAGPPAAEHTPADQATAGPAGPAATATAGGPATARNAGEPPLADHATAEAGPAAAEHTPADHPAAQATTRPAGPAATATAGGPGTARNAGEPPLADRATAEAGPASPAATPAGWPANLLLADPSLDAMELDLVADGRFLGARSTRPLSGGLPELGAALAGTLTTAITTIAAVSGARERALGAIATDSIGNRLLWTPDPERALSLAGPLVAAIGLGLPKPRFVRVGRALAVRRASCCLIYEAGNPKCASCPRQPPAEREARLRAALG